MLSRDIRIQGRGFDQVSPRAADPAQPVVTVPRGITATISGVAIAVGRVGVLVIGRSSLAFTMVSENPSGGIEVRDSGTFEADKLRVTRNKGPGLTVTKAEAVQRQSRNRPHPARRLFRRTRPAGQAAARERRLRRWGLRAATGRRDAVAVRLTMDDGRLTD